jgi:serine/threonine protein phosphatase PrpC
VQRICLDVRSGFAYHNRNVEGEQIFVSEGHAGAMRILAFGKTDPGKRRTNNEDAYLCADGIGFYAVADGIGGNAGGEVASRIAVDALAEALPDLLRTKDHCAASSALRTRDEEDCLLRQAVTIVNNGIRLAGRENPDLSGMGTTLTMLLFRNDFAYTAHIGDSRAYLLRSGELTQLTADHSFVAEQVRAGVMTAEQARISTYRHVITRALGTDDEVQADIAQHRVQKNDRFLLCTDGLTEMVDDGLIRRLLPDGSPETVVQKLVAAAIDGGGVDNITVVVVWVTE